MPRPRPWGLFVLALLPSCGSQGEKPVTVEDPPITSAAHPGQNFHDLVDDYIDFFFRTFPTWGTDAGYHQYDDRYFDFSETAIQKTVLGLKSFQRRLHAIDRTLLAREETVDYDILDRHIENQHFRLTVLKPWAHDPMAYADELLFGLDQLVQREFEPLRDRLDSIIARERRIPDLVRIARANLDDLIAQNTRQALETLASTLVFLDETLPGAVSRVVDARIQGEFRKVNQRAIDEVRTLYNHLRSKERRARAPFALGPDNLSELLRLGEMIDLPIETLLRMSEDALDQTRDELVVAVEKIAPETTPEEAFALIQEEYGEAEALLRTAAETVDALRAFVIDKDLLTLPDVQPLRVVAMPPYLFGFAMLMTPGPLDPDGLGSYYFVTPIEADWEEGDALVHLQTFNRPVMTTTAIHDTYPGRFVQGGRLRKCDSRVRKLLPSYAFLDGWAHYVEGLVLEQGYSDDPLFEIAVLRDRLLRLCRMVVAIRIHAFDMSLVEAYEIFTTKGYQEPTVAQMEVNRAVYDPMVMSFALGRMMIEKLRDDYATSKGSAFSLKEFHDRLLSLGAPTLPAARRLLLPGDERPPL